MARLPRLRAIPAWLRIAAAAFALSACIALAFPQSSGTPRDEPAAGSLAHEILTYAIEWRLIPAGTARMTWTPAPRPPGSVMPESGEVRLHLESAGLVSRLFRVEDEYAAALGPGLCAQSSTLTAHEGSRNKETKVIYDSPARKATWTEKDLVKNSTSIRETEIPSCVHDVIGGLMVLRNLRLEPGKTAQLPVSDGRKFVQARVESQRREEIRTDLGSFRTIRSEVFLFNNVLYKRSGHLHVWLTDDERRLLVQLQVRLQFTIGTITFRLVKEER